MRRRVFGFIVLIALALAGLILRGNASISGGSAEAGNSGREAGGYILALSWSPAWCQEEDPSGKTDQCDIDRNTGLVVHGLWAGSREDSRTYCATDEPERLPRDLAQRVLGFMPSIGLARHEWKKHGSCMGLGQRGYFETMEKLWRSLRVPPELRPAATERQIDNISLRQSILAANPALPEGAVNLGCDREGDLSDIRICLTEDLKGRPCPTGKGRGCPRSITLLPPP